MDRHPLRCALAFIWLATGLIPAIAGDFLRQALLTAAGSAANAADHSVIQGSAPAGSVLHLHKQFDTKSSPICTYAQGIFVAGSILSPLDCVSPGASRVGK